MNAQADDVSHRNGAGKRDEGEIVEHCRFGARATRTASKTALHHRPVGQDPPQLPCRGENYAQCRSCFVTDSSECISCAIAAFNQHEPAMPKTDQKLSHSHSHVDMPVSSPVATLRARTTTNPRLAKQSLKMSATTRMLKDIARHFCEQSTATTTELVMMADMANSTSHSTRNVCIVSASGVEARISYSDAFAPSSEVGTPTSTIGGRAGFAAPTTTVVPAADLGRCMEGQG
eukprot:scaffold5812_cov140-Isochrysis_galbana.AAC.4